MKILNTLQRSPGINEMSEPRCHWFAPHHIRDIRVIRGE
jgi:hypothetical protein